jgi:pimeloyl-ACP methyl ester carboxylesterase
MTVENAKEGQAIIVGHAFDNWVARMTAVDHPEPVRGVVIAAAASKDYPKDLLVSPRDAWQRCSARISNGSRRYASLSSRPATILRSG